MKYSQLRRGLSPEDAAAYVGSKELLRQFERAKWLKPFVRGNRLTRFDIRDLDGCIDRLKAGEICLMARTAYLYRERFHDLAIVRPEFCIMALHDAHIVAEPRRDSVNVDALLAQIDAKE